jgi:hypothetical protein
MTRPIGRTHWAIADGYIPSYSHGPEPQLLSHETLCILNTSDAAAEISLTLYFATREPAGPYRLAVPPCRTLHVRTGELEVPEPVPRETDYAMLLESNVPVVVQHTRLDSRQSENALMSSLAYAADSREIAVRADLSPP